MAPLFQKLLRWARRREVEEIVSLCLSRRPSNLLFLQQPNTSEYLNFLSRVLKPNQPDDSTAIEASSQPNGSYQKPEEGRYDFGELHKRIQNGAKSSQMTTTPSAVVDDTDAYSKQEDRRQPPPLGQNEMKALDWTGFVTHNQDKPLGSGGFGDVYDGEWNLPILEGVPSPPRIVVKKFRIPPSIAKENGRGVKAILREIAVWRKLDHDNVVPFVGIYLPPNSFPCLVSEWICNGSVKEYIKRTPSACLRMMIGGIIRGLQYLHEQDKAIVHGDLKADNVLVNKRGWPCICDFGLSRILVDNSFWNTSASHAPGTVRWMSPELLEHLQPTVTTQSDIYAYAMTCIEVLTGSIPFEKYRQDAVVLVALCLRRERPERDASCITDDIWNIMQECWLQDPSERPSSSKVSELLGLHKCEDSPDQCIFRVTSTAQ